MANMPYPKKHEAHSCTHEPSHTCNSSPQPAGGGAEGGEHRKGKWKGGRNYYHSLPSQLIKSITSNMFLMMVKAGGNWFIWRCFKVNFSQVQRRSLKLCPCVYVHMWTAVCVYVCRMEFMSLGLTLMFQHGKPYCHYQLPNALMTTTGCVCLFESVCDIIANLL